MPAKVEAEFECGDEGAMLQVTKATRDEWAVSLVNRPCDCAGALNRTATIACRPRDLLAVLLVKEKGIQGVGNTPSKLIVRRSFCASCAIRRRCQCMPTGTSDRP